MYIKPILKSGFFSQTIMKASLAVAAFAFSLGVSAQAPANDECAGALDIAVSANEVCATPTVGTTIGATNSGAPASTCNDAGSNDDVWFKFVATSTSHRVTISNKVGIYTDMVMAFYSGSCGNLTYLTCSNPDQMTVNNLTVGNTYYIRAYTFSSTATNVITSFDICVLTPPPPPANDECSGAVAVTPSTSQTCGTPTSGTTQYSGSSSSAPAPTCGATGANDDVWYSFVASAAYHTLAISNIAGTATTMSMSVYSGSCGSLTEMVCLNDVSTYTLSNLTVGSTYYVRIWTTSTSSANYATFDFCITTPPPPPANDNCANATALTVSPDQTCPAPVSGTTQNASASSSEASPTCNSDGVNDDVWYSFVAVGTAHVVSLTNVTGSTTNMTFAVYSGSCGSLTELACSDPNSATVGGLTPGNTYYVRVYTVSTNLSDYANFSICIGTPPPPPANDDCSGAVALTVSAAETCATTTAGTTTNSTSSSTVASPSCAGGANDDVWYSFVAADTRHIVTLSGITGSSNMAQALYSGTCANLAEVGCSADNAHMYSGLTVGNTYYVRVWSESTSATAFSQFNICIGTPPPPPVNDLCSGAISLTGNTTCTTQQFTNAWAGDSGVPSPGCANYQGGDVWFSTVVPASGLVKIETSTVSGSALTDGGLAAYSGTCDNLTLIACDDESGAGSMSMLDLGGLAPGSTIYIRVWEYGGNATGNFNICVTVPGPPPANDDCANAVSLTPASTTTCTGTVTGNTNGALPSAAPAPTCSPNGVNDDVWYSFVATSPYHSVHLSGITGTSTQMAMAVYEGACGSLNERVCITGNNLEVNSLTVGETYFIRVWTVQAASPSASFNICVATPPAPPANDEPCNATWVSAAEDGTCNYTTYTTTGALASLAPEPNCANYPGRDVWFRMIVPCTGTLQIDTKDMDVTDGALAIYTGSCDNLTLYACNDDGSLNGAMPMLTTAGLNEGDTIYIRFWSTSYNTQGNFGLCVSIPQIQAPQGQCNTSQPFCVQSPVQVPNITGQDPSDAPGGGVYGCLGTIPNPSWYYLQIDQPGSMDILIQQYNTAGQSIDVDFVIWGPFTDIANACTMISATNIVDCSYSASGTEHANIPNAQVGQYYLMLVTNFNGDPGQVHYEQEGGTGSSNCAITCEIDATNTSPVCGGSSNLMLEASEVPNATYEWVGPACFSDTLRNVSGVTAPNSPGTYIYYVTATTPEGSVCFDTTMVTVMGAPMLGPDTTLSVCGGSSVDLTQIKNLVGLQNVWTFNGDTVVTPWSVHQAGTYNVIAANVAGCKDTTSVTINMDSVKLNITTVNPGCMDNQGTITVTPSQGNSPYMYSIDGGEPTADSVFTGLAPGNYTIRVQDATMCAASQVVSISTDDGLFVNTIDDALLCNDAGITLTTESNGASFSWSPATGLDNATSQNPVATPAETTTYIVTATLGNCIAYDTVRITKSSSVSVNAGPDKSVLSGEPVVLEGSVNGTASILWTPSIDLNSPVMLQPTATPVDFMGTRTYVLTATNINGCVASDSMVLTVIPYCIKIRNAFTPNGDGINDLWMVYDTRDCVGQNNIEVLVYNRYGSLVYENKNYNNDWNGTYKGKPVPDGVYYAIVRYKLITGKTVTAKSDVNILR